MKKFFVVFALLSAMVLMISCGNSSSSDNNSVSNFGKLGKECYPNKSCDGSLLCDEESNICVEDPENPLNDYDTPSNQENDENEPVENNDSDTPIENNDNDNLNDHNDDNKPIDNDKDDIIGTNDDDSVSITDEDNPVENNDSDEIPNQSPEHYYGGCAFTAEDMVATKEEIATDLDTVRKKTNAIREKNKEICLGRYTMKNKEDSDGNFYIVDECEVNNVYLGLEEPIWYENVIPTVFSAMGLEPNTPHRILNISKGKWCMNKGDPLDIYIKIKNMKINAYVSVFECLEQAGGDMLNFEIAPSVDGECIGTTSTSDQVIMPKQHTSRTPGTQKDKELCATMPNYQYDEANNICHTTITEEVYMGHVAHTLLNVKGVSWAETPYRITYMKKDINTNVIYMDMLVNDMVVHITLQNPKDPCLEHEGTYATVPPVGSGVDYGSDYNYDELCPIG
jgi:AAA ATPase containing von Willebrand factor type A (vWA) domain